MIDTNTYVFMNILSTYRKNNLYLQNRHTQTSAYYYVYSTHIKLYTNVFIYNKCLANNNAIK